MLRECNINIDFVKKTLYLRYMIQSDWRGNFQQARLCLTQGKPESALHLFSDALKACPVSEKRDLEKIIFYTGLALKKLGMTECALRAWKTAKYIDKCGPSAKMLKRFSNGYGMPKQSCEEEDDFQAFKYVQIKKYLTMKKSGRFGTEAERDMVNDLILEHWFFFKKSSDLSGYDYSARMQLFLDADIYFPLINVPSRNLYY